MPWRPEWSSLRRLVILAASVVLPRVQSAKLSRECWIDGRTRAWDAGYGDQEAFRRWFGLEFCWAKYSVSITDWDTSDAYPRLSQPVCLPDPPYRRIRLVQSILETVTLKFQLPNEVRLRLLQSDIKSPPRLLIGLDKKTLSRSPPPATPRDLPFPRNSKASNSIGHGG